MNAHPAVSADHWRPGFARRADNFEEVCQTAASWRWQPGQYVGRIMSAIAKGTPELSDRARSALVLYVDHLNQERLESGQAFVWVSIGLMAEHLGCSEREMRRTNMMLEKARFLIREYNRANRPAGHEAVNLAPLLARMDELETTSEALRQAARDRRAAYLENVMSDMSAQADEAVLLEQSQINDSYSVTDGNDAPTARDISEVRRDKLAESLVIGQPDLQADCKPKSKRGSSRGACFERGGELEATSHLKRVRQELDAALQVCPELAQCVSEALLADPQAATPHDIAQIVAAAEALLPETDRNNGQTALWGYQRHGLRIVAMLAVALKDPSIQNPARYFGKLATWDSSSSLDLRMNLTRLLRSSGQVSYTPPPNIAAGVRTPPRTTQGPGQKRRGGDAGKGGPPSPPRPQPPMPPMMQEPSLMKGPGADDPVWIKIDAAIQRRVRQGAYGSWFARLGFHGLIDGELHISTPGPTAAEHIKRNHLADLLWAAEAAGEPVRRIIVTVRSRAPASSEQEAPQ